MITRDRRASLGRTLAGRGGLPERPPVIVVDNGSTDGTPAWVRKHFPHHQLIESDENLGAAGRNLGVAAADTAYVAFSDDDSWWEPGALARAAALLDDAPDVALVAGRILVGPEGRPDPVNRLMEASPLAPHPGTGRPRLLGFVACGAVVRRAPFLAVGGFDETMGVGGEETLLALDLAVAGWSLVHAPSVVARHHPDPGPERRGRDRHVLSNDLVVAWARLPVPLALRATARALW